MSNFKNIVKYCGLADIAFSGFCFTWDKIYRNGHYVQQRLNRIVVNPNLILKIHEAKVTYLPRTRSDHCPLLLSPSNIHRENSTRPFRLETTWLECPDIKNPITNILNLALNNHHDATTIFSSRARAQNKNILGNIFNKKDILLATIQSTQNLLSCNPNPLLIERENNLKTDFLDLLNLEDKFWVMKSRTKLITDGDRNTKYYHVTTLIRRNQTKIRVIKDMGLWISDPSIIKNHFQDLFF